MRLMHTKLPEFIKKMKDAANKGKKDKQCNIEGLENLKVAKLQSLRTGRIEQAVEEIANMDNIENIEIHVMPRVPETMHTLVIKGYSMEGEAEYAIVESINILHPTDEMFTHDVKIVDDRRAKVGDN